MRLLSDCFLVPAMLKPAGLLRSPEGPLRERSKVGNSRFFYAQSSLREHHLNYFNHILELFKPYLSKDFIVKERQFTDKRTNANYSSVQFATLSLPCFNYYKDLNNI